MRLPPSALVLVPINLVPIGGVLWFDWSVTDILLLYGTESVAIGIVNVARMIASDTGNLFAGYSAAATGSRRNGLMEIAGSMIPLRGMKLVIIPFFGIHYGLFCFAHISAIAFLLPGELHGLDFPPPDITNVGFWVTAAAIFASHIFSFFTNFIGKGEYRRTGLITLMNRPYGRIVVMQVTIIAGAALATHFGAPLAALLVLVLMKTAIDLRLHQQERARFAVEAGT